MSVANYITKLQDGSKTIDFNRDGKIEADSIKVKNLIVEQNITSTTLTLNNQNFTTNNNTITSGIDGITVHQLLQI